jgi:hypothetical protein
MIGQTIAAFEYFKWTIAVRVHTADDRATESPPLDAEGGSNCL